MDVFTTRLANTLREKLEAEANDQSKRLAIAISPDYANYTQRVGHIQGIKDALRILSEVEKSLGRAEDAGERAPVTVSRYES